MKKQVEMFTMTARIPDFWGEIIPEIEISVPKHVVYGIAVKAADKAIKRGLKKHSPAQDTTTADSPDSPD